MTATLGDVTKKIKPEPTAEELAAQEMVRRPRELTEHLGHDKNGRAGPQHGNVRNGTRPKTVLTEASGQVGIEVPRDRAGTFEPQIVRKRQRRLTGVDQNRSPAR
jgi:transposase-like protein